MNAAQIIGPSFPGGLTGDQVLALFAAGALGFVIGATELFTRYRDSPRRLLAMPSFWAYSAFNAIMSGIALCVAIEFGWTFGASESHMLLVQIAVSGLGAAAILRSSVAVVRVGDQEIPVGAAVVVKAVLDTVERAVGRNQAMHRSDDVARLMRDVSFEKSYEILPEFCIRLVDGVPPSEGVALAEQVNELRQQPFPDEAKSLLLGVLLIRYSGRKVLEKAISALDDVIKRQTHP